MYNTNSFIAWINSSYAANNETQVTEQDVLDAEAELYGAIEMIEVDLDDELCCLFAAADDDDIIPDPEMQAMLNRDWQEHGNAYLRMHEELKAEAAEIADLIATLAIAKAQASAKPAPRVDLAAAEVFLKRLDSAATGFTFQTFSDRPELKVVGEDGKKRDPLARVFHGTLEQHAAALQLLNQKGAGVFVVVNATDGRGRATSNVTHVRALFADFDCANAAARAEEAASMLVPHLVIESSPTKRHVYWFIQSLPLPQFKPWQQHLAARLGGDPAINDLPRVMRLPGFIHSKGEPFGTRILQDSQHPSYREEHFVTAFGVPGDAEKPTILPPLLPACLSAENAAPHTPGKVGAGGRHAHLVKTCSQLARQGLSRAQLVEAALLVGKNMCSPPKEDREEIEGIVDWVVENVVGAMLAPANRTVSGLIDDWPDTMPLLDPTSVAAPFPLEALGGHAATLAFKMRKIVQAPAGLIGQVLLGAMSLAAQSRGNLLFDHVITPASLFLITLGASGERKSSCERIAFEPIRAVERELLDEYRKDLQDYKIMKDVIDQEKDAIRKNKKLQWQERVEKIQGLAVPTKPRAPYFEIGDPTLEGLLKQLIEEYPSAGLINDDAGQVIGGHSMSADNRMKTLSAWTKLWDTGNFDRIRSGSESGKYFNRRMSMHLMLQPYVAQNLLGDPLAEEQGFLARCLLSYPDSTIGSRIYSNENLMESAEYQAYAQALDALVRRPLEINDAGEIQIRELSMTSGAAGDWIAFHNDVEAGLGVGGEYHAIRAYGARAAENAKRLALTFALVENPDATEVTAEHLDRAITCMVYYLSEALRVKNMAVGDPVRAQAQRLLTWLLENGYAGAKVKVKKIQQCGPGELRRSADLVRDRLQVLCEHGHARALDATTFEIRPDKN